MRKIYYLFISILFVSALFHGCNNDNPVITSENTNSAFSDGPILDSLNSYEAAIVNSSNAKFGTFKVWFDRTNLYFRFTVKNTYRMKNIYLAVSPYNNNIPLTGNCPNISKFTHKHLNLPANTITYTIVQSLVTLPIHGMTTIYLSGQVDLESASLNPDCTTVWIRGLSFPGCSTFSKYFSVKFFFAPN